MHFLGDAFILSDGLFSRLFKIDCNKIEQLCYILMVQLEVTGNFI